MAPSAEPTPRLRRFAAVPTAAELAALRAYLDGGSTKAAAHRLGLSEQTVKNQLLTLRRRLGVATTAQAVARLYQNARFQA